MIGWLREVHEKLARLMLDFDPALVPAATAAAIFEEAADLEVAFGCLSLMAQARAAQSDAWRADGAASPEQWVASKTGRTRVEAAESLAASKRLEDTPHVAAAVRRGEMPTAKAATVSKAARANPAAEQRLVRTARTSSVEQLRTEARAAAASARPDTEAARQRRAHERRFYAARTDDDGSVVGHFRLTALAGARLAACLQPFHDRMFDTHRAAGLRERPAAIAADALIAMAEAATTPATTPATAARRATIVARVDLTALQRGHTTPGEEASIDGIGPVPVTTIAGLVADATIVALSTNGDRIVDVRLAGRAMPDRLRHAVTARDRHCVVPGCDRSHHLEIHHLDPVANGGSTFLDGLALICPWHHDQITHRGATLWREPVAPGAPGGWHYTASPPDEPAGGPFDDGYTDIHPGAPPPLWAA